MGKSKFWVSYRYEAKFELFRWNYLMSTIPEIGKSAVCTTVCSINN